MELVDKALVAQKWIMNYYRCWIPLDACLELINSIDNDAALIAEPTDGEEGTTKPEGWELDLLNKIGEKVGLPAGQDFEGIIDILDKYWGDQ